MKWISLGRRDDDGRQVRIEHRGRYTRASRTGGVSVRAQAQAAGINFTVNSQHGLRLSQAIAPGTQVAFQRGRLQLRGRYGRGPDKINLSASGLTVSRRNALGTFNWIRPNRSSAKIFGVQVRGKKAAQLQIGFMLLQFLFTALRLLLSGLVGLTQVLARGAVALIQATAQAYQRSRHALAHWQDQRCQRAVARRVAHPPARWDDVLQPLTVREQLAALCWIVLVWGRGRTAWTEVTSLDAALGGLAEPLDIQTFIRVEPVMSQLALHSKPGSELHDELAVLALLAQRLAKHDAQKLVEDILRLDEHLSQQQKTCLQQLMIETALDYAGVTWQVT